ncbi:MAG TPA: serine hydrolase domain-containing protein [Gemmatimonadales bacterium]|jgi:CubicO group peptidase (beta-lactamase class C family)
MTAAGRRGVVAAILMSLSTTPAAAQTFAQVDEAAFAGIRQGLYPGAVVVIGRRDSILYARGYGHFTWNPASRVPDPDSTLWDIASITKVVASAASAMRLVDQGKLDLDAPVGRYLPRFSGGLKKQVTVRMLLDHTSGLKPYEPIYRRAGRSRSRMIKLLYAQPLVRPPGDSAAYSDLNAMLLGLVIESASRTSLDRFADVEVFNPLGMEQTRYLVPARLKRRTVPSGIWRGEPVPGDVNDQNAAAFGGVAGHAGVFSTGMDLARFAQVWLRDGMGPDGPWVGPATMRQFLTRGARSGTRLLGWDSPELNGEEPSIYGTLISQSAYGHTGFTGTELWIDPTHDLFLVFLTNRTFDPKAQDSLKGLKALRTEMSDAAIRLVPHSCAQDLVSRC